MIDTPAQGHGGEDLALRIKEDAAAHAATPGLVAPEDLRGIEIGPTFERQRIELELPLADRRDQAPLIADGYGQPHGGERRRARALWRIVMMLPLRLAPGCR